MCKCNCVKLDCKIIYQINQGTSRIPNLEIQKQKVYNSENLESKLRNHAKLFELEIYFTSISASASKSIIKYFFYCTFIAASVCIYPMFLFLSPISPLPRCKVLTIPDVTVLLSCNGLPSAATNSPGLTFAEDPSFTNGNFI